METIEIISIPAIVTVVCAVMQMMKKTVASERFDRVIPLLSVLLGAALGGLAFYIYPALIPADSPVVAILIGAASGWAATGAHQTGKQLMDERGSRDGAS